VTETARLLLVGRGRMGRLVESLAGEYGFEISGCVDRNLSRTPDRWPSADVAIDFSTGDAVPANVAALASRGTSVVIGTTGWQAHEAAVKDAVARHDIAVVAAPNFALGVNVFLAVAEYAASLASRHGAFGGWIHELHHATKRDAPSGTALALERAVRAGGFTGSLPIASTRAGSIPGTHTVGFDAAAETITLTHEARDRSAFARGALEAARWVKGKRGWFSMRDVIGL
jgi:4-hydroxy-tetrahydrodipicolinate reductase